MGFSSLIIIIGMVFGPIIAGLSYDLTGSYRTGFIGLALVAGLGSLLFLASTRPPPPPTQRRGPLVTSEASDAIAAGYH